MMNLDNKYLLTFCQVSLCAFLKRIAIYKLSLHFINWHISNTIFINSCLTRRTQYRNLLAILPLAFCRMPVSKLLQNFFFFESLSCVWLFVNPWTILPWNSPGPNTGVGTLSLLQGIFPTQELNRDLLNCRWILYQLSYQGSPITELRDINFDFSMEHQSERYSPPSNPWSI